MWMKRLKLHASTASVPGLFRFHQSPSTRSAIRRVTPPHPLRPCCRIPAPLNRWRFRSGYLSRAAVRQCPRPVVCAFAELTVSTGIVAKHQTDLIAIRIRDPTPGRGDAGERPPTAPLMCTASETRFRDRHHAVPGLRRPATRNRRYHRPRLGRAHHSADRCRRPESISPGSLSPTPVCLMPGTSRMRWQKSSGNCLRIRPCSTPWP